MGENRNCWQSGGVGAAAAKHPRTTRSTLVLRFVVMTASSPLTPKAATATLWPHAAKPQPAGIRHVGLVGRQHRRLPEMARLLRAGLLITLVLLTGPSRAQAGSETPKSILDLLYPQSAGWTRLNRLPHPSPRILDDPIHVETLGYFERLQTDADRCSPMLRMFLGRGALDRFRTANIFGTGDDDLIYAGPKPCAEGAWTVIWQHGRNPSAASHATILDAEIQRLQSGSQPKAVGVAPGCCGDPWDYYCLYDPIPREDCTAAPEALTIPDNARLARSDITLQRDVTFLPAPNATFEQGDPYRPPVRPTGTKVEQLLIATDRDGHSWRLVRVAAKPGEFSGSALFLMGWERE